MADIVTGKIGEDFIANLLLEKGYTIVARNYHSRFGEIDIIVSDAKYIVFVEVKTRKENGMTEPFENVTKPKQGKIKKTAQIFLMHNNINLQPRFDVAAVFTNHGLIKAYDYLTDAFW